MCACGWCVGIIVSMTLYKVVTTPCGLCVRVINMMKSKDCGGDADFKFIRHFVKDDELKVRAEVIN